MDGRAVPVVEPGPAAPGLDTPSSRVLPMVLHVEADEADRPRPAEGRDGAYSERWYARLMTMSGWTMLAVSLTGRAWPDSFPLVASLACGFIVAGMLCSYWTSKH